MSDSSNDGGVVSVQTTGAPTRPDMLLAEMRAGYIDAATWAANRYADPVLRTHATRLLSCAAEGLTEVALDIEPMPPALWSKFALGMRRRGFVVEGLEGESYDEPPNITRIKIQWELPDLIDRVSAVVG